MIFKGYVSKIEEETFNAMVKDEKGVEAYFVIPYEQLPEGEAEYVAMGAAITLTTVKIRGKEYLDMKFDKETWTDDRLAAVNDATDIVKNILGI